MCRSRVEYICVMSFVSVSGRLTNEEYENTTRRRKKKEMESVIFSTVISSLPNKRIQRKRVAFTRWLSRFDESVKNLYASFLVLRTSQPFGIREISAMTTAATQDRTARWYYSHAKKLMTQATLIDTGDATKNTKTECVPFEALQHHETTAKNREAQRPLLKFSASSWWPNRLWNSLVRPLCWLSFSSCFLLTQHFYYYCSFLPYYCWKKVEQWHRTANCWDTLSPASQTQWRKQMCFSSEKHHNN